MKITRSMLEPFPAEIPGTPEQWDEVAKAFKRAAYLRSDRQEMVTAHGLCWAGECVTGEPAKSYNLFRADSWGHAIHKINPNFDNWYWFPRTHEGDLKRSQVARLIAEELRRRAK